jgi:membrane protease YdiL (CAAX protease family)
MEDPLPTRRSLVLLAVVFEGGLGVVALALGRWLGCPPLETLRWTPAAFGLGAAAGLPMMVLLLATVRFPVWPFSDVLRVVDELLVPLFRRCRVVDLALISVLAGLGEEMLFRGVIQEWAARWVEGPSGPWVGLAVAAVLFGLAHAITPSYVVLAGLMGLYLGLLWIVTGNLLVPILAHAVYDFLALAYLVKVRRRPSVSGDEEPSAWK